jgi:hypothetical protein
VIITGGSLVFFGINLLEGNDKFYKSILMPCMRKALDPEQAHLIAIKMAKWNLVPNLVKKTKDDEILVRRNWSHYRYEGLACLTVFICSL